LSREKEKRPASSVNQREGGNLSPTERRYYFFKTRPGRKKQQGKRTHPSLLGRRDKKIKKKGDRLSDIKRRNKGARIGKGAATKAS